MCRNVQSIARADVTMSESLSVYLRKIGRLLPDAFCQNTVFWTKVSHQDCSVRNH
jgi:hypothetical protein